MVLMYHGTQMAGNRRAASCRRPASRISPGGSSGAGGFRADSTIRVLLPRTPRCSIFSLPLGAVHGFAVGNRVRQGENDHERVGMGRFGQANLERAKLSHAFGVESAGLAVPADGDPQRE